MKITIFLMMLAIQLTEQRGFCQEFAAARVLAEELAGSRMTPEAIEKLAARICQLTVTEGDEVLELLRRGGPRSLRLLEEAGDSPAALRLLACHGDEAAALIRRPIALRLAQELGDPACHSSGYQIHWQFGQADPPVKPSQWAPVRPNGSTPVRASGSTLVRPSGAT